MYVNVFILFRESGFRWGVEICNKQLPPVYPLQDVLVFTNVIQYILKEYFKKYFKRLFKLSA